MVNWDAVPSLEHFGGRHVELARLDYWVRSGGTQLIGLFGLGGEGKSALCAAFVQRMADSVDESPPGCLQRIKESASIGRHAPPVNGQPLGGQSKKGGTASGQVEQILWCSLSNFSTLNQLLHFWLQHVTLGTGLAPLPSHVPIGAMSIYFEAQLTQLLEALRQGSILLILDQVEAILAPTQQPAYLPGWEWFGELLRRLAESEHRSCLLLTSREKPQEWVRLARRSSAVRSLYLQGLTLAESVALLCSQGLDLAEELLTTVALRYQGHPLALTLVLELVNEFPSATVQTLLEDETLFFDELRGLLTQHMARLSAAEQELLIDLTLEDSSPMSEVLWNHRRQTPQRIPSLEAWRLLQRRCLIHLNLATTQGLAPQLPSLVSLYIIQHMVETICHELIFLRTMVAPFISAPAAVVLSDEQPLPLAHAYLQYNEHIRKITTYTGFNGQYPAEPGYVALPLALAEPFAGDLLAAQSGFASNNVLRFSRISLDLLYLHRCRLALPSSMGTARDNSVVNRVTNCAAPRSKILESITAQLAARWGDRCLNQTLHMLFRFIQDDALLSSGYAGVNLRALLEILTRSTKSNLACEH